MPVLPDASVIKVIDKLALSGLNTWDDPKDIGDTECADIFNMVFDDGVIFPRQGSSLVLAKPSGETGKPFQQLTATGSDGIDYQIVNYGFNFYLVDTINNQWIQLNHLYTPSDKYNFYGSTSWNNGTTDDRFYFGNGVGLNMKWIMAVSELVLIANPADTTLVLRDSTHFPKSTATETNTTISFTGPSTISDSASGFITAGFKSGMTISITGSTSNDGVYVITTVSAGTIVVTASSIVNEVAGASVTIDEAFEIILMNAGTPVYLYYTGNTPNTLTLVGTVGTTIPAFSTITVPIQSVPNADIGIPKASVFVKSFGRLFSANSVGAENTLHYSVSGFPEDHTVSSTINSGGFYTVYKGKGGIIGMVDYGSYLMIDKQDVKSQFIFNIASDLSSFEVSVEPIMSGDGIGPVDKPSYLSYMNTQYYPTQKEGILSFSPTQTGGTTTSGLAITSQKINNYITQVLNFSFSRTCGLNQKLYWACDRPFLAGVPISANNLVIMYDLIRQAWTKIKGWDAVDIKPANNQLYYLSVDDGGLYLCYQDYQDQQNGEVVAYPAGFVTKRFNGDSPETLKKYIYGYVEGYISLNTRFYINALSNENSSLGSQSFVIAGNNPKITNATLIGGLGTIKMCLPLLAGVDLATMEAFSNFLFFRCYLEFTQAFRPHNIQFQCYSLDAGSQWGITTLALINVPDQSIETQLVLGPSTIPPLPN